jgi:hypothetical protein
MAYAAGKYAKGLCDRCGFKYHLHELQKEWTGFKVCYECYEPKHPQLELNDVGADPVAIYEPRPDTDKEANLGRVFTNLDDIGFSFYGYEVQSSLGTITVTTE